VLILDEVYIHEFLGGWWSWEPLCRSCIRLGLCCATSFVKLRMMKVNGQLKLGVRFTSFGNRFLSLVESRS